MKTFTLLESISTVYSESEHFLYADAVDDFCDHIGIDPAPVMSEFIVIEPMLSSKTITDAKCHHGAGFSSDM